MRAEFKGITKRADAFLEGEEGFDVEFKESLSGLDPEDLIAFANSEQGGTILIGVAELRDGSRRRGKVIGCAVGDMEKRKILDKAQSCTPPVDVTVLVENAGSVPFYRIEVPAGKHRPYCTGSGTYKTRGDGQNQALYPQLLLSVFLKAESGVFLQRFRKATKVFEAQLKALSSTTTETLVDLRDQVHEMRTGISWDLSEIKQNAENATGLSDETVGISDEIYGVVFQLQGEFEELRDSIRSLEERLAAILDHLGIPDPFSQ